LILAIALICIIIIVFAALITLAGYCIAKYGERRADDKKVRPGRPQ
jgi:heme/copper-type cytochrome/quinol oxidase subunit 2